MRIGFEAKRAFCNNTGLGNYGRTLIENFNNSYPSEEIYLYTPDIRISNFEEYSSSHDFHIRKPEDGVGKVFKSLWKTHLQTKQILKDGVEVYHGLSHELPYGIDKTPIKTLVSIHDLIFLRYPELYSFIDRKSYDIKFKHACDISKKILAISKQTADDIISFYNIPASKIEVLYQTCHEQFYHPAKSETLDKIKNKYSLPKEYLLYVGTIEPRKNALAILRALKQRDIDTPLVIIGTGKEYLNQIKEFVSENNLENQVFFLGRVPFSDLPSIYQLASVFVWPSFFEGFGIPILEAMFSKTPVITSIGSCFSEVGGDSTIYIDPENINELADAIKNLLNDSKLRLEMAENGFLHAQNFKNDILSKQLFEHYQST